MINLKHLRNALIFRSGPLRNAFVFLCLLHAIVKTDSEEKCRRVWVTCFANESAIRARNDLMYSEKNVLKEIQCPIIASKFLILSFWS